MIRYSTQQQNIMKTKHELTIMNMVSTQSIYNKHNIINYMTYSKSHWQCQYIR